MLFKNVSVELYIPKKKCTKFLQCKELCQQKLFQFYDNQKAFTPLHVYYTRIVINY